MVTSSQVNVLEQTEPSRIRLPMLSRSGHGAFVAAIVLAVGVIGWAILNLVVERAHFAIVLPGVQASVEAAAALSRLFGALVFILFPQRLSANRARWIAAGLIILGFGGALFGNVLPLTKYPLAENTRLCVSLILWIASDACFVIALVPNRLAVPTLRWIGLSVGMLIAALVLALVMADHLPVLVRSSDKEVAALTVETIRSGLTRWHWGLSLIPLALATVAAFGAARRVLQDEVGRWLLPATVLLAGSQLHNMFWPSAYSPVLTTANVLRLGFAVIVAVGGIVELRRVSTERENLLAVEQEARRRMAELGVLKSDFTAMVAHELSSPAAAIHTMTTMLETDDLPLDLRKQTTVALRREADLIRTLVADVRAAASAERYDFAVYPFPVDAAMILAEAAAYARTLPGDHPVHVPLGFRDRVLADPERIAQVLRNLLLNAAKYSDPGTPIAVHVGRDGDRLRIEVVDRGHGIRPEDLGRIFEKFGRGQDLQGRGITGSGLGLYLSRRILLAHETDLAVQSKLDQGTIFSFSLQIVR